MRVNRREIKRLCSEGPTMDFRLKGACLGGGVDVFYPDKGGDVLTPMEVCDTCAVRDECLAWGICHEKYGVWGGSSENQRRRLRSELGVPFKAIDVNQRPPCGTDRGFEYHRRHGEETCRMCRMAHAARRGGAGFGWAS